MKWLFWTLGYLREALTQKECRTRPARMAVQRRPRRHRHSRSRRQRRFRSRAHRERSRLTSALSALRTDVSGGS